MCQENPKKYGIVLGVIDGECDLYLSVLWPDKTEVVGCYEVSVVL